MTMRLVPYLAVLSIGAAGACQPVSPAGPSQATLAIQVEPSPLVVRLACPEAVPGQPPPRDCLASMSPTVTIRETAGIGGRIEGIDITLRLAGDESRFVLGPDWLMNNAGTDRIEGFGALGFRPVVNNYPVPYGRQPAIQITLSVRFRDDRGHSIVETVQLST
jgi:hypothetical protein